MRPYKQGVGTACLVLAQVLSSLLTEGTPTHAQ